MDTKEFISSINLKLKNENGNLVSFNGQSITFRLYQRSLNRDILTKMSILFLFK